MQHQTRQEQMSEAFFNCVFLALSGGFQDAYTYNVREGVFSNAQTGNVVLMSQHMMNGGMAACAAVSDSASGVCRRHFCGRKYSGTVSLCEAPSLETGHSAG